MKSTFIQGDKENYSFDHKKKAIPVGKQKALTKSIKVCCLLREARVFSKANEKKPVNRLEITLHSTKWQRNTENPVKTNCISMLQYMTT